MPTEIDETTALSYHYWESVGGEGSTNFHVFQLANLLHFLEDVEGNLSGNFKSFTFDLDNHLTSGYTDSSVFKVDMIDGEGRLFVVAKGLEPFYLEYDSTGDSISSVLIGINVRDFTGLDDQLEIDERPASLSEEHDYNLKNQGWWQQRRETAAGADVNPITAFNTNEGAYPSNADIAWLGMVDDGSGNLVFSTEEITLLTLGNTPAPKGHFIIDPFNIEYESLRLLTNTGGGGYAGGGTGALGGAGGGGGAGTPPPFWIVIPTPPPDWDEF